MNFPDLIMFEDFDNNWDKYVEEIYKVYLKEIKFGLKYLGLSVTPKRHPEYKNKENSFWHLTTEGKIEESRNPDLRRCERIKWIKYIFDNISHQDIIIWENERKGSHNVCISVTNFEYLIILGQRKGYFVLLSAYPINKSRIYGLKQEYEAFIKQNPPK